MCLAIPGKVVQVEGLQADVEMFGLVRRIFIGLVPDAAPGDWVLVHVGSAIDKVAPEDAAEILAMLEEVHSREAAAEGGAGR